MRQTRLKLTFPEKNLSICCRFSKQTIILALREIYKDNPLNMQKLLENNLSPFGNPLITRDPSLSRYMEEICDGWYLNTQGGTRDKYIQSLHIKKVLDLNLEIEAGEFEIITKSPSISKKSPKKTLKVIFEDGTEILHLSFKDVFIECIRKIGAAWVCSKDIMISKYSRLINAIRDPSDCDRVEFEKGYWIKFPSSVDSARNVLVNINIALAQSNKKQIKIETINLKDYYKNECH